jgi:hypothetical protein
MTVRYLPDSSRNYVSDIDPYRLNRDNNALAHGLYVAFARRGLEKFDHITEGALHGGNLKLELPALNRKFGFKSGDSL